MNDPDTKEIHPRHEERILYVGATVQHVKAFHDLVRWKPGINAASMENETDLNVVLSLLQNPEYFKMSGSALVQKLPPLLALVI